MQDKSIQENDSTVKNKSRTRRVIPPGVAITLADINKLPKRSRGPKKLPLSKIVFTFRQYINRHPALTATTKQVACLLAGWYNPTRRMAWGRRETIAEDLSLGVRTVARATAILHDLGLVFTASGGYGSVRANQYVPNLWLVVNEHTGAIIKNAKYDFSGCNPRKYAESVGQTGTPNPVGQTGTPESGQKREKRLTSANPVGQTGTLHSDNGVGGAPASPASANATARSAPAPSEKESEIDITGYETQEFFISLKSLARELGITPEKVLTSGNGAAGCKLDKLCYANAFTGGKVVAGLFLEPSRPKNTTAFVCLELIAKEGIYWEKKTSFNIAPDQVNGDSPVFIQYRIPPAVREQANKDFADKEKVGYFT